jgi:DNA-binding transcriptional regulator YiaG
MPPMTSHELTTRREALHLSQAELAQRFGVHTMTVSKWERGLHRIPEMVGMALSYLEQERRRATPPTGGQEE